MQSGNYKNRSRAGEVPVTAPATDNARKWAGWGTALKPATEFWTLARKPLSEATIAENVLKHGTGALHIDACRIVFPANESPYNYPNGAGGIYSKEYQQNSGIARDWNHFSTTQDNKLVTGNPLGRYPANVVFDEVMAAALDQQTGELASGKPTGKRKATNNVYNNLGTGQDITGYGDTGGASRFFYVAKADAKERGEDNTHATVKPLMLMQYLVKLVCPPGGVVLEPFAGSGTTCIAAKDTGNHFIAFEINPEYAAIAEKRLQTHLGLFHKASG